MFVVIATAGQHRPTRVASLVVLTTLLGLWLFGEGLIWTKRSFTMLRGQYAWATDPNAWEWTALLAFAYATVVAVGASLRFFSSSRRALAWGCAGLAVALFAGWSVFVNYSAVIGVIAAGIALAAISADANQAQPPTETSTPSQRRSVTPRALVIAATTVVIAFWVIIAFLWFAFREGENVQCGCWADQRNAWQYSAQLLLALAGSGALAVTAGSWLKRSAASLVTGGTIALCSLAAWIGFYLSASYAA
jgi:hypothetical protein